MCIITRARGQKYQLLIGPWQATQASDWLMRTDMISLIQSTACTKYFPLSWSYVKIIDTKKKKGVKSTRFCSNITSLLGTPPQKCFLAPKSRFFTKSPRFLTLKSQKNNIFLSRGIHRQPSNKAKCTKASGHPKIFPKISCLKVAMAIFLIFG